MNTRSHRRVAAVLSTAAVLVGAGVLMAQPEKTPKPPAAPSAELTATTPSEIVWKDGPASLPSGVKMALLQGSPEAAGPFVMRLKMPKDGRVPAHTHPGTEQVTIISGTVHMGMGKRPDADKVKTLPAGSFVIIPAGVPHFVWAEEETVVQIHGVGPWGVTYADPATDPRNKK